MNLPPSEILLRCERMVDHGDNKMHSKHAITMYLIASLFLGDIDDRIFKAFLVYFDKRFENVGAKE